jgi:hypothetical protein
LNAECDEGVVRERSVKDAEIVVALIAHGAGRQDEIVGGDGFGENVRFALSVRSRALQYKHRKATSASPVA